MESERESTIARSVSRLFTPDSSLPFTCYNPLVLGKFFRWTVNTTRLHVEIFGQTYNVRGEGDPNYLTELARFVDSRMREVAAKVATVDPMKIAILAALNIADEFSRYRKEREQRGRNLDRENRGNVGAAREDHHLSHSFQTGSFRSPCRVRDERSNS